MISSLKVKVKVSVWCPIKSIIENNVPPITGAGIKNFSKKLTFFFIHLPNKSKIIANPTVSAIFNWYSNIQKPPKYLIIYTVYIII